jgi:Mn2+/Fe2+ NRAMP family transporter
MKDALAALLRSRKFMVYVLVALLGAAFVLSGKLSIDRFDAFVSGLGGILIAAIAYEDGQAKSAGVGAVLDAAPIPVVPPLPPRPPPRDSSTRLARFAFASAFAVGGALVLCVLFLAGCAGTVDDATTAAAKAYQAEQDACFDDAEHDAVLCPDVQPTRATCLAAAKTKLHQCRLAVRTRWGRA